MRCVRYWEQAACYYIYVVVWFFSLFEFFKPGFSLTFGRFLKRKTCALPTSSSVLNLPYTLPGSYITPPPCQHLTFYSFTITRFLFIWYSPKFTIMVGNKLSVFYNWSLEKHWYPFKNMLLFLTPLPTQYNFETQEKLQVLVFNIVCGVGGEVR